MARPREINGGNNPEAAAFVTLGGERTRNSVNLMTLGAACVKRWWRSERWFESEANRIAGQIALLSPEQNAAKAQTYFESALMAARKQQAKSWELGAAMSMARLWRDLGRPQEARELVAPVYSWLTEGFDTRDLKEAKVLLDGLAP
jgi:predicted ATPase